MFKKYKYINDHLLKEGKIEEKEADELKNEIDKKIHYLNLNLPEINLDDQKSQIIHNTDLFKIFSREELEKAFRTYKHDEHEYFPGNHIVVGGD